MMSHIIKSCRNLQRPLYAHLLNQTVCYRSFHLSPYKSSHQQVPSGNLWTWQWWNKFWRTWAPVPTLFGITIFIVWQYSRKLQHRYINDECSTASQLEIQCYRSIPLRFLSRSWGKLSQLQIPTPFRRFFYTTFSKTYGINLDEVSENLESYASLGEFFIRHLKQGVRPIALTDLVSPADGTVLNCGQVTSCCVEQVKGTTYLIRSFLGDNTWSLNTHTTANKSTNTSGLSSHVAFMTPAKDICQDYVASKIDLRQEYITPVTEKSDLLCQDYLSLLGQDILGVLESELHAYKCTNETGEKKDLEKHNFAKAKSKSYALELPVVPSLLDYYVKDILQSVYSSVSLLLYRGNLTMTLPSFQLNATSPLSSPLSGSSSPSKPPICTPSAEEEWAEYKKHLLRNPRDNELYQLIVYLAPGDYHRFHSPAKTNIQYRRHFQACWIPDLFVLNERAAYMGEWKHGFFSMVMVGATNVGSIKVHCDETLLTNSKRWGKGVRHKDREMNTSWDKGQEVGEFRMGSTVVLLFEAPKSFEFAVTGGDKIKVGQSLMKE
ncbi:hypothetical protein M8J76_007486 [Diaphorina citri]|nr:hypothetical protein M8J76_007486 [Diaphorina citri]